MSGLFGIFNRDGLVVSNQPAQLMHSAMAHWRPDSSGLWQDGPIALGHEMLWNTPESKLEQLPDRSDQLIITMDARLDNRLELALQLGIPESRLKQTTDSALILAAYKEWLEDCPRYLLGDFAFAIWDEQKQQLFCARDQIGIKQFYYHLSDLHFIFSNDLRGILSHPRVSEEINDEAVANYLLNHQLKSPTLTFFAAIEKLPPAHSITISADTVAKTRYWQLEDSPRIRFSSMERYADRFRELLEQAVHDRLRSDYPISSHLSGGLDSSSISVIAARKLKEKNQKLLAFNWLHKPTNQNDATHYEWANSQSIAHKEEIDHHYVSLDAADICEQMKTRTIAYGNSSTFWYEYPVRNAVQEHYSRTLLSGWGGDEFASYHGQAYYADLFRQGKLKKLIRELKQAAVIQGRIRPRRLIAILYRQIFLLLVPRKLYHRFPGTHARISNEPLFESERLSPILKAQQEIIPELSSQHSGSVKEHMLAYWNDGHIQARITSWATGASLNRLEYSYPLLDRRILEFIIGLPAECFVEHGKKRYLFRTAARGLISEDILWSDAKSERNRVERLASMLRSSWKLLMEGGWFENKAQAYLDEEQLRETLESIVKGDKVSRAQYPLMRRLETTLALYLSEEFRAAPPAANGFTTQKENPTDPQRYP